MEKSTESKPRANDHENYLTFTLISIIIPIVGVILGIVYLTKNSKVDRKIGEHMLTLGILFSFIVWPILGWIVLSQSSSPTLVETPTPTSLNKTPVTSNWDYQTAYEKIETGMTKSEVETVTGKTGTDCSEAEYSGYKSESCTYGGNNDPGFIIVQYDNGVVSSKAKQAL